MTSKNTALNTDQLIKIMMIGIVATLVLTTIVGILYVTQNILPKNSDITPSIQDYSQSQVPQVPEYSYASYSEQETTESDSTVTSRYTGISDSAVIIESFIPDDPWYSQTEFNNTPPPEQPSNEEVMQTLYENSFTVLYTPISIRATVDKGPLVIDYQVIPSESNPLYSFLEITVSDYNTGEVLADGGYAREYSTEESQEIKVLSRGDFRIDIYGGDLDLYLKVQSGILSEIQKKPVQTAAPEYPDEMPWW